jgi:hypothetical protein
VHCVTPYTHIGSQIRLDPYMLEFGHVSKYDRMYPCKRPTDVQHIHQLPLNPSLFSFSQLGRLKQSIVVAVFYTRTAPHILDTSAIGAGVQSPLRVGTFSLRQSKLIPATQRKIYYSLRRGRQRRSDSLVCRESNLRYPPGSPLDLPPRSSAAHFRWQHVPCLFIDLRF